MKRLYFLLFSALILILGGLDRGFDITDEGLYALLAHPFQENQRGIFNYDLFFKALYKVFNLHFGLMELRVFRLIGYGLAAYALSVFLRNISKKDKFRNQDFLIPLFGLFGGYAFLPQSLSYNHLTVILASCWLALISGDLKKSSRLVLLGLVLGLLVYVKISSALILTLVTVAFLKFKKLASPKLGFVFLPFLLIELAFFIFLETSASFRLWSGLGMTMGRQDYALWTLFKHTLVGAFWIGMTVLGTYLILMLIKPFSLKTILTLAWSTLLIWLTHITEEWNHAILIFTAQLFALLALNPQFNIWQHPRRIWILLLVILPFLLHLGSNVYWLRIGIHYWVFWIVALWILSKELQFSQEKNWIVGLGALSCFLIFSGVWWKPFEQKPLWKSRLGWEYLPGKKIKLMPEQIEKLQELQSREDIHSNSQILAVYRISGLPFLLGKTMPKSPGFWDQDQLKAYFPDTLPQIPLVLNPISELPYSSIPSPILLTEF